LIDDAVVRVVAQGGKGIVNGPARCYPHQTHHAGTMGQSPGACVAFYPRP
jgi:hypothetical protein